MKKLIFLLLLPVVFSCREDSYYKGDFFFLVNKGAEMPVSVRGDTRSGVFIVFIHGGPGGTALQKIGMPAFNDLEQSYATVFWDQRASGSAQGNSADNLLTLPQFVEDLDKIVDLIHSKYNQPRIFLMGHSWGGCLGTAYLVDKRRQDKVQGWIEVDGAHNNPKGDSLSLNWVKSYAKVQIAQGVDVDFWNYALKWYTENPNFTSDQLEHYAFVEKAHGYIHDRSVKRDPANFPGYSFRYAFDSPADLTMALTNYNHVIRKFIISDIDLTAQMKDITLPSLIIWGEYDGVIPFPMSQDAFNSLGTDPSRKSLAQLPASGHVGFYEEPEAFASVVRQFIEKYK